MGAVGLCVYWLVASAWCTCMDPLHCDSRSPLPPPHTDKFKRFNLVAAIVKLVFVDTLVVAWDQKAPRASPQDDFLKRPLLQA